MEVGGGGGWREGGEEAKGVCGAGGEAEEGGKVERKGRHDRNKQGKRIELERREMKAREMARRKRGKTEANGGNKEEQASKERVKETYSLRLLESPISPSSARVLHMKPTLLPSD